MGVPFREVTDTIKMANDARKSQGNYEMEISFGGAKEFRQHFMDCQKNPGHHNFLPVNLLAPEKLPPPYRHNRKLANLVKSLASITVCINVGHISDRRPSSVLGSDTPYPLFSYSGRDMTRAGSGWVWRLERYGETDHKKCYCPACKLSDDPASRFGKVVVHTSAHLVFDESEGEHATCYFFYDSDDTDAERPVSLATTAKVDSHAENDTCVMEFITHDLDFLAKLGKLWQRCDELLHNVRNDHQPSYLLRAQRALHDKISSTNYQGRLVIIVSHPHGRSKMVSFGETVSRVRIGFENRFSKLTYTAPTCRGCSGAAVYVLRLTKRSLWWPYHPHSGLCPEALEHGQVNSSGVGYDE